MKLQNDINSKNCYSDRHLSKYIKTYRANDINEKMKQVGYNILDVLFVGATGVGKSATINSLLGVEKAEVGKGTDPKTMTIFNYFLSNNIRIWDTPGLGDSLEADKQHAEKIIEMLSRQIPGDKKFGFIDMVVVLIDSGTRDMGTVNEVLNNIIIPNFRDCNRIIIGLNQADFAMKGQNFNYHNNHPNETLKVFLDEKASSIKRRVKESTGHEFQVVYFSAETGYNLVKFLDTIIENIPNKKRYLG